MLNHHLMNKVGVIWILLIGLISCSRIGNFQLHPEFTIYVNEHTSAPIVKALDILQRDIKSVLGKEAIVISDIKDANDLTNALIIIEGEDSDLGIKTLEGFERHKVYSLNDKLILQGSDVRGTIYAIYSFSEIFLGIKPLWYWCSQNPPTKELILIPNGYSFDSGEPYVKYRTWFPNDTDMFSQWRKQSKLHNEVWLETMLRMKLNCVEINHSTDYSKMFAITADTKLIDEYGLKITYHHISALNSPYKYWDEYWIQIRHKNPPKLDLSNITYIEEFWRYNVRTLVENGIDPIWVVNFRVKRDMPFWSTSKDASESTQEAAISKVVEKQVEIIKEETGNEHPLTRLIFYDELSDLMAEGSLYPPYDKALIWNFMAAHRDHFPNKDIRSNPFPDSIKLGYYMNPQFDSMGSHLTQAEGPWQMEERFRQVDSINSTPFYFSIANTGNFREHLLTLSANAELLWNFHRYDSDEYIRSYCSTYFGEEHADCSSKLYKEFFYAYWRQKKNDLAGYERQYIFHDLRYKQVISQLSAKFFDPIIPNPLENQTWEQMPSPTFENASENNNGKNQMTALLRGTAESYINFKRVALTADSVFRILDPEYRKFFNDDLRNPAYFMMYLNESLHQYCLAYMNEFKNIREEYLINSLNAAMNARESIFETAHDQFGSWYAEEWIFDIDDLVSRIDKTLSQNRNMGPNALP